MNPARDLPDKADFAGEFLQSQGYVIITDGDNQIPTSETKDGA
jgi:hypothetical protein